MKFNGSDYDHSVDAPRLTDQHLRVKGVMLEGHWLTLSEISELTGDPEASISAQLRHLKKERFGAYVIERRRRPSRTKGLFEYRMLPPGSESKYQTADPRRNRQREALEFVWSHPDTTQAIKDGIRRIFEL